MASGVLIFKRIKSTNFVGKAMVSHFVYNKEILTLIVPFTPFLTSDKNTKESSISDITKKLLSSVFSFLQNGYYVQLWLVLKNLKPIFKKKKKLKTLVIILKALTHESLLCPSLQDDSRSPAGRPRVHGPDPLNA